MEKSEKKSTDFSWNDIFKIQKGILDGMIEECTY